jgi:hypothetical protein
MIEKLLELFIAKIDTNLFESVELEYLEARDVEDPNEVDLLHSRINQGPVAEVHKPHEQPIVHTPSKSSNRV